MQIGEAVQSLLRDILPDGEIAIDLGIGGGRITDVLQERGFQVYGCDIDPTHAEAARARGIRADAEDVLAWEPSEPADVITCMELIEHLTPDRHPLLLNRMRQWLVPGGTAIVSTPQRRSIVASVERAYVALRRQPYNWWDPTHVGIRTRRQLRRIFKDAGFTIERVVGLHLMPHLAVKIAPPLRRFEWSRHEGRMASLCFDLIYVLRSEGESGRSD